MIRDSQGKVLFAKEELQCSCCGQISYYDWFLNDLLALRLAYKNPMSITSGCRCYFHNKEVGGATHSKHLFDNNKKASAVDIKRPSSEALHKLIKISTNLGWTVGIGDNFIHLDKRTTPIIFTYY